jgi:phosphoserine aminotransferase
VRSWRRSGLSALELPFTGPQFAQIAADAEADLRHLLDLPASYRVLFLQGGATAQFSLVPMNLLGAGAHGDYVQSGYWSRRAIEEAARCCDARVIATGTDGELPSPETWRRSPDAGYCHFTSNESADGLQFHDFPAPGPTPLVVDMTGDFLTRPLPIDRFGLIYASAQKTLGAAGLTIVLVHADLLGRGEKRIPAPFDLSRQAAAGSKLNTPPTFSILVAARMLRWLVESGGLAAADARCRRMSTKLCEAIDRSGFYRCPAAPADRSLVNVCFRIPDARLEEGFVLEAEANGLRFLRGHPKVGGLRASLYSSTPEAAVDALVDFMARFKERRA